MTTYTRTQFGQLTCEACGRPCPLGIRCDPCHAAEIRSLLNSKVWMEVRGTASGDLPGETLADTMRRELAALTP